MAVGEVDEGRSLARAALAGYRSLGAGFTAERAAIEAWSGEEANGAWASPQGINKSR